MNKKQLVDLISTEVDGVSKDSVSKIIDALTETIIYSVKKEDKIALAGFGTFEASKREAREGINPFTKEKVTYPAKLVPKFKASKAFKDRVAS